MEFAAIDFETANERPDSACQLGVVVIEGGEIVSRHSWMIRPRPLRFSPRNISIHGITPDLVRKEADFGQLWGSISGILQGRVLVAHNARFDIHVLRTCLQHYRCAIPEFQFTCTRAIARRTWPDEAGYGLQGIADRLGISFVHHDALEDAECCAQILLAAAAELGALDLPSLERRLGLSRGTGGAEELRLPNSSRRRWTRLPPPTSAGIGIGWSVGDASTDSGQVESQGAMIQIYQHRFSVPRDAGPPSAMPASLPLPAVADLHRRAARNAGLVGQRIVITGNFSLIDRDIAWDLVSSAGGAPQASVTRETTMLVMGAPDPRTIKAGRARSTKQERAESLRARGQAIEFLSEREFLERLLGEAMDPEEPKQEEAHVAMEARQSYSVESLAPLDGRVAGRSRRG